MEERTHKHAKNERETEILSEIRNSEKEAEIIIENARREAQSILQDARRESARILADSEKEIKNSQDKLNREFAEKIRLLQEQKLAEGKKRADMLRATCEKNIPSAVEFVMEKFEEII